MIDPIGHFFKTEVFFFLILIYPYIEIKYTAQFGISMLEVDLSNQAFETPTDWTWRIDSMW